MEALAGGSIFAGHRIEGVAGRGGMGVVYRATHLGLERTVALKVISSEFAEDEAFRKRFKREARIAASIDHPNVIPLFETGEEDGQLFMSMRFVKGTDLGKAIAGEGALEIGRAAGIVDQVADALDAAHEAGLVHRDVKPANVLIERRSRGEHANLTDFGLTRLAAPDTSLTDTGMIVGTVDYCAPEQLEGVRRLDARTDVYALGCVLFHALTGRPPFPRETAVAKIYAHTNEPPPVPSEQAPTLPAAIDDVVLRAMAKDPDERYLSAGDLGRAALAAARGASVTRAEQSVATGDAAAGLPTTRVGAAAAETVPARGREAAAQSSALPAAPPASRRPRWRRPILWLAGGAAALVATTGAVVALTAGGDSAPENGSGSDGGSGTTPAPNRVIAVNRGISGAELGMSQTELKEAIGEPDRVERERLEFATLTKYVYPAGLTVLFGGDSRVINVATSGVRARTPAGVGVGSGEAEVERGVDGVECKTISGIRSCQVGLSRGGRVVTAFVIKGGRVSVVRVGTVLD